MTLLREYLHDALLELGFGTSNDGECWAMLVQTNDGQGVRAALLDAWRIAFDVKPGGTNG